MARENIQPMQGGDVLSATKHMNPIIEAANRMGQLAPGAHMMGRNAGASAGFDAFPPGYVTSVRVVEVLYQQGASRVEETGLYRVHVRYYDGDPMVTADVRGSEQGEDGELGRWRPEEKPDKKYILDTRTADVRGFGLGLRPGDEIGAYWHNQRGSFIALDMRKRWCRFQLREPLSRRTPKAAAQVTEEDPTKLIDSRLDADIYGPGNSFEDMGDIEVINFFLGEDAQGELYEFSGAIGDVGLAFWDAKLSYRIVLMHKASPADLDDIVLVQAVNCKLPGASVLCNIFVWNPDTNTYAADNPATATVHDPMGRACLLPGEYGFASKRGSGPRYDFLGEQGLSRSATMLADTAPGATKNALIEDQGTSSNCQVPVQNGANASTGISYIFSGHRVFITYLEGTWVITSVQRIPILGKIVSAGGAGNGAMVLFDVQSHSGGTYSSTGQQIQARNKSGIAFATDVIYRIDFFQQSDEPLAFPYQIEECPD